MVKLSMCETVTYSLIRYIHDTYQDKPTPRQVGGKSKRNASSSIQSKRRKKDKDDNGNGGEGSGSGSSGNGGASKGGGGGNGGAKGGKSGAASKGAGKKFASRQRNAKLAPTPEREPLSHNPATDEEWRWGPDWSSNLFMRYARGIRHPTPWLQPKESKMLVSGKLYADD